MAKVRKDNGFKEIAEEPGKKPLATKGALEDVDVATVDLEKDELADFKAAKKSGRRRGH
jgi:hypothetical protein